jgi:hypothetical protein
MVMKLPGRTPASEGMKSPPELASKMVTLRISPIPKRRVLGGRRSVKAVASLGLIFARTATTSAVTGTKAYGRF